MTISIVTVCLNDKDALIRTRESVECQLSHDYEHIIIDGYSNDGTIEYLNGLDKSVKWLSEPDDGISDAFNKGIALAEGRAILCLNAGDVLFDENVIGNVISDWNKYQVDVLSYMVEMSSGQIMWCKNEDYWEKGLHAHQGLFISRAAYRILGGYNVFLKSRMDYDLFLRMARLNLSHKLIDKVVARFDGNGISQYEKKLAISEGTGLKLIYEREISTNDYRKLKEFNCVTGVDALVKNDSKHKKYTLICNWLEKTIAGKKISNFLEENGIMKVSVYGAGQLGALLLKELKLSDVMVVDLLDVVEDKRIGDLVSINLEKMSIDVDAVIVTVIEDYEEISEKIRAIGNDNVFSLREIVASL